jgi:hypothetical protein
MMDAMYPINRIATNRNAGTNSVISSSPASDRSRHKSGVNALCRHLFMFVCVRLLMVRSSTVATPLYRLVDVGFATAALLFVAPLLVLTLAAQACTRSPRGSLQRFLHKSGLADLPRLFDVIEGRSSLVARQASDQLASPAPGLAAVAPPMRAEQPASARHQTIELDSDLAILGRNFRDSFRTAFSNEFDDLLRAIDRGQRTWTGTFSPA